MRKHKIVRTIYKDHNTSIETLENILSLSANTIRKEIFEINKAEKANEFCIENKRKKGYQIVVNDSTKFQAYINNSVLEFDYSNQEERVNHILYHMLQELFEKANIRNVCCPKCGRKNKPLSDVVWD